MAQHTMQKVHKPLGKPEPSSSFADADGTVYPVCSEAKLMYANVLDLEKQALHMLGQSSTTQVCAPGHNDINSEECEARIAESGQELGHEAQQALTSEGLNLLEQVP